MAWTDESSSDEADWVKQQSAERKAATARRTSLSSSTSSFKFEDSDSDDVPLGQKKRKSPAKQKSPAKAAAAAAEEGAEGGARRGKSRALATRLPLSIAAKVRRSTLLLESSDPSLDLSGDFGCIGRLGVNAKKAGGAKAGSSADPDADAPGRQSAVTLDLKGRVYDGDIVPCSTVCLVSVDGSRAKIEAVFSDYVQLQPPAQSIFDMETVQHGEFGTGFFDDDGDHGGFGASDEDIDAPLKQKRGGAKLGGGKGGRGKKGGAKKGGAKKPAARGGVKKKR